MNSKDKAIELIDKFVDRIEDVGTDKDEDRRTAKECALICVEEAKEQVEIMYPHPHYGEHLSFWILVGKEIELL